MTRNHPLHACLLAAMLLSFACGAPATTSTTPTSEPPTDDDAPSGDVASAPVDTTAGYHARLAMGMSSDAMDSNWTDFIVPEQTERGRAICEVLLEAERTVMATADVVTEITRPCEPTPLPPRTIPSGGLLVDERPLNDMDIGMKPSPLLRDHDISGSRATIRTFSQTRDGDACRALREQVLEVRAEAARTAATRAEQFLATVISYHEEQRDQLCEGEARETRACAYENELLALLEARHGVAPAEPPPPVCLAE